MQMVEMANSVEPARWDWVWVYPVIVQTCLSENLGSFCQPDTELGHILTIITLYIFATKCFVYYIIWDIFWEKFWYASQENYYSNSMKIDEEN